MTHSFGFLTMAFGAQRYLDQAIALARSLKRHMPGHRVCLVTDRDLDTDLFDDVVVMNPFGVPGTVLKTHLYDYTPYEETFFIDSDCIVVRDFSDHVDRMKAWDFTPVCNSYLRAGDTDLWLKDVGEALDKVGGEAFPKFNGGVYFFRKSDFAARLFALSRAMFDRRTELGVLDFDAAGPGEETLIGLALAELRAGRLYDDDFQLMRTPLNSKGRIVVDPIGGRSSMHKNGRDMSPAIMHFCGEYAKHPAYLVARRALEIDGSVSALERARINFAWKAKKVRNRLAADA